MLITIAIIAVFFAWLGYETNFLTIRLESCGYQKKQALKSKFEGIKTETNSNTPYWWKSAEEKHDHVIICHNNWHCPYLSKCRKTERWTGWKLPARTVKAFGHTFNFLEGCNIQRAITLKSVAKAQKSKPRQPHFTGISLSRHIGYVEPQFIGHTDLLCGKNWLRKHQHDEYPEPVIDISVNGKSISVNGDYRKGVIKEFMEGGIDK